MANREGWRIALKREDSSSYLDICELEEIMSAIREGDFSF